MMVAQRGRFWNDSFGDFSKAVCLNRQYRTLVRYGLSVFWSLAYVYAVTVMPKI